MIEDLINHYNESKSRYDVKGESHLDYYRDKYPENYIKLKQHKSNNIMNLYRVFIDVPQDDEWENIDVETMKVEAFNCDDAKQIVVREAEALYEECYVWEITEDDKI